MTSERKLASFRLSPATLAQLDVVVEKLQEKSVGRVSRADAVTWSIGQAADKLAPQKIEAPAFNSPLIPTRAGDLPPRDF